MKPKVHAFGHIHEGYGTKEHYWEDGCRTLFINASTCNLGYQGIHKPWVVDVEASVAIKASDAPPKQKYG